MIYNLARYASTETKGSVVFCDLTHETMYKFFTESEKVADAESYAVEISKKDSKKDWVLVDFGVFNSEFDDIVYVYGKEANGFWHKYQLPIAIFMASVYFYFGYTL